MIPIIRPDKFRYRLLHNQIDLVLSAALRTREDIIVARVSVPLVELASEDAADAPASNEAVSGPSTQGRASQ